MAAPVFAQVDPRELVRRSIANGERAWEASRSYSFRERDIEKRLGSGGRVVSVDDDVYDVEPIGGLSYERMISHNGRPLSGSLARKQKEKLDKALHQAKTESEAERRRKIAEARRERSFMKEVPDAFNWNLLGEEQLPTGPAYVLEATPRPGFHPKSRYAHAFSKMRGKLWIDKHDLQWVTADAEAIDTVSFGFFIARLAKGSHIILEQMKLPDGTWVPKTIIANAAARIMLVVNRNFEEKITYSDYRKGPSPELSARK